MINGLAAQSVLSEQEREDFKQVIGDIERVIGGGIEVNEKIDEVIEGGKGKNDFENDRIGSNC